jgi:hypothetical protein
VNGIRRRVRRLIALDDERTLRGARLRLPQARRRRTRAHGTSSNDATTTVQVINRLHDCRARSPHGRSRTATFATRMASFD